MNKYHFYLLAFTLFILAGCGGGGPPAGDGPPPTRAPDDGQPAATQAPDSTGGDAAGGDAATGGDTTTGGDTGQGGLDAQCLGKDEAFAPYADSLVIYCDDTYMYIEPDNLADHEMMVGITASNQQVPIPQPFHGDNAWRIPLHPVMAQSTTPTNGQGPVGVAINGVMLYDPTQQDGVYAPDHDPYLIGELDGCGGHSGRADDYHYHVAPNCIIDALIAANGGDFERPIAYALDGYPIYPYYHADGSLPTGLDECGGEYDADGSYHYHARLEYPYVNGCYSGEVDVSIQPRTIPVRPAGEPIQVLVTALYTDADGWNHMEYEYQGTTHAIVYFDQGDECFLFKFVDDITAEVSGEPIQYCRDYSAPPPPAEGGGGGQPPPP